MPKAPFLNSVQTENPRTNGFDLTHTHRTTGKMGILYPVMCVPLLPGDKMRPQTEGLFRFQPMVAPPMERFNVTFHTWRVDNWLLWPNWHDFITQTKNIDDVIPAHPYFIVKGDGSNWTELMGRLGIPKPPAGGTTPFNDEKVNPMRIAAYFMTWDNWYRDENLQDSILDTLKNDFPGRTSYLVDGDNTLAIEQQMGSLLRRAWKRDYFTGQLPFAQKGAPVEIPIGNFQNVPVMVQQDEPPTADTVAIYDNVYGPSSTPGTSVQSLGDSDLGAGPGFMYANTSALIAQAATFNDFRLARAVQNFLELQARGGSRYNEFLKAQWGVTPRDARLQLPEYICGSSTPVQISEVLNTTGTVDAPQGQMAGHGISHANSEAGSMYADDYGYLFTLMSIMPEGAYSQGLERDLCVFEDPLDHFLPVFAELGEQAVVNKEIYAYQGATAGNTEFGYLPAWSHHRIINNRTSGDFLTTLAFWTVTRKFLTAPALDASFIQCNPSDDIFAVQDGTDQILCLVVNKLWSSRKLPVYGTPSKY